MSSYFDERAKSVAVASATAGLSEEDFMRHVSIVEESVIRDVLALTGDREFPADLRDLALARIATLRAGPPAGLEGMWPPTTGERRTRTMRRSALIDSLHNFWHSVAATRTRVRWGVLTDDLAADVKARDCFDARGEFEPPQLERVDTPEN